MRRSLVLLICLIPLSLMHALGRVSSQTQRHTVSTDEKNFLLDGKPIQIISGEMHYPRVPRAYWRDRLRKARAMGLNTVSTYVFWNLHEPKPGEFLFQGNLDVAAFVRAAQEEGLYVILRPGPYVCAEWDLGGLPAWLLKDSSVVLRSTDEKFLGAAEAYLARVGRELATLQYSRGGPIIAVQVENEYGSFEADKKYMTRIRDAILRAGLGEVLLFTADGPGQLAAGTLPDVHAVVNFGPGSAEPSFRKLREFRSRGPLMSGEYWAGWFDHWGTPHHTTKAEKEAAEVDWMLSQGYSINFYMFHGGTTFGFMNGANLTRDGYRPQTTSYDYDAALDEAGRLTKKYFAFREVIQRHRPAGSAPLPEPPGPTPIIAVPEFRLTQTAPLRANLGKPTWSEKPRSMESFGQSYGYVLYRTTVRGSSEEPLSISDVRDFAAVYVNGARVGTLDRRLGQKQPNLRLPDRSVTLEVLVENSGRINFMPVMRGEQKGITKSLTLGEREITGWDVFLLPMEDPSELRFAEKDAPGPAFYRGRFTLREVGDTFFDMRGWSKGAVWINGHCLGRFWGIGPQQTLYVPGAWLRKGENQVVVFEIDSHSHRTLRGVTEPVLNEVRTATP